MGAAARRTALLRWSPAIQGRVYANILVDASLHLKLHGRRAGSPWEPVMDDEPFSPALSHVEEYALAGMEQTRPPRFRVLRRVGEIVRTEGVGGVTRRVKGRLATRRALARR